MLNDSSLRCPECSLVMTRERHHGVKLERCILCEGVWFDLEEVHKYLRVQPGILETNLPREFESSAIRGDSAGECPCCHEDQFSIGAIGGVDCLHCSWCGGFFLSADKLKRLIEMYGGQGAREIQHRKKRRGLITTFFVMWCVMLLSFLLGVSGKVGPKPAIAVFLLALCCSAVVMLIYFFVVRCGGCGKLLFNPQIDPLGAPDRTWREFICDRCGDTTLVKGQAQVAESDHL